MNQGLIRLVLYFYHLIISDLEIFKIFLRYEIKMNIDSWDNVTFELTYEELLERSQDRYQHWVSIAPSQVVKDLTTTVNVNDLGGIKWIRAYPVQSGEF